MPQWIKALNVVAECRLLRWGLWQCPPFLFLLMGIITIVSMVATYVLAARYTEEPQIAALVVIVVTLLFLVMGNIIIVGFNQVAVANRLKSEFISIISHQLRSPLSIFKWTLDVLEREAEAGKDHKIFANFLETLRTTSERMIHLVNSLLEVNRIEAGAFALKKEEFSLVDLTKSMVADFRKYAASSNITLAFEPSGSVPPVIADRERMAMVLQNFIDNAIRYTKSSGSITITVTPEKEWLRWTIKDQGVGIPAAQQKYIFQKFFRADKIAAQQTRGSGLGLYIAKAIVEASGGEIGFSSEEGKGSTFWFTLPIK